MKTDDLQHVLSFGERQIPYRLAVSARKNLRIAVLPSLEVRVSAPSSASEQAVARALQQKAPWIVRQLERQRAFHPLPTPKRFVSGETFVYLGRQYRLKVIRHAGEAPQRQRPHALLVGGRLKVTIAASDDATAVRCAVQGWYSERAADVIPRLINRCYAVVGRHGVAMPRFTLRQMRTRWGSCSPAGLVTLNAELLKVPVHCIEYVITHELCHLRHHNHSRAFYRLLTRCMPDWQTRKNILDQTVLPRHLSP